MPNFLSELYYRFKYGIRIHRNVLSEESRLNLMKDSCQYLEKLSTNHPGLQTPGNLHEKINYENYLTYTKLLKRIGFTNTQRCWVNYSDHGVGELTWHTHNCKLTTIYYLENPENIGTVFRHKGKVFRIDVPTNTLMIIPGSLEHTGPYTLVSKTRYTFVIDTN